MLKRNQAAGGESWEARFLRERKKVRETVVPGSAEGQPGNSLQMVPLQTRKPIGDMNRILAPGTFTPDPDHRAIFTAFPSNRPLEFIRGEQSSTGNNNFKAFEMNIRYAQEEEFEDGDQQSTYFAAALTNLLPSMHDAVASMCMKNGHSINFVAIPRDLSQLDPTETTELVMEVPKAAVIWGMIILMLFKNPTSVNFEPYCRRRIMAMSSIAGYTGEEPITVFPTLESALRFRNMYGQDYRVRRTVLLNLLDFGQDYGVFSRIANYVKSILKWTDMAGYLFVYTTLFLTSSPVLDLDEVLPEVRSFYHATRLVIESGAPSYYKILEDPDTYPALERQQYPTLLAISRELKSRVMKSASQFVAPGFTDEDTKRIKEIADLHYSLKGPMVNNGMALDISWLTQESEQFEA